MHRNTMILCLLLGGLAQNFGFSDELVPDVTLTFSNLDNGGVVDVIVTINNRTKEDATLTFENTIEDMFDPFLASVIDDHGKVVSYTEEGKKHFDPLDPKIRAGSGVTVPLSPGESQEFHVPIGKYFDLSKPGTYVVRIHPKKLVWIGDKPIPTDISVKFQVQEKKDNH